ncbi:zinc finger BED domain-containing protein RICESLEEPER 2 [Tanacetum coccineum]
MRAESARKHEEIIDLLKKFVISIGRAKEVEEWEKWRDLKRAQEAFEDIIANFTQKDIIANPKSQIFVTKDCDDGSRPEEHLVVSCSDEDIVKYPTQPATTEISREDGSNLEQFLDVLTVEEADITEPIMAVEDEPLMVLGSYPNISKEDFSNDLDGQHSADENPTKKCHLLAHGFRKIISYDISKEKPMSNKELESKVEDMVEEVKTKMGELFGTYKERFDFLSSNSSMGEHMESEVTSPNNGDNDFLNDYYNVDATSSYETETELDRYLREPKIELRKGQSLDILQWWKVNGPRFPIVSKMARDILAIQISTVASEAAFSTGGRVLDPYRTRLSTTIVEALICTQDWVRKSRTQINWDDVEDLIKDDEIVKDMEEQLEKLTERDKAKQTGEI